MTGCAFLSWLLLMSLGPESIGAGSTPTLLPDRVFFSGRFDHLVSGSLGGAGGASWLRSLDSGRLLEIGVYTNHLGNTTWHYGRLGAVVLGNRKTLTGSLELGGGSDSGEGFAYVVARGGVGWFLSSHAVRAEVEAEYISVQETRGPLLRGTLAYTPKPRLGFALDYRHGLSPQLDISQVGVRADAYPRRLHLLGGISSGTFLRPELIVAGLDLGRQTEWFGGVAFPIGENELTVVFSNLSAKAAERYSVSATLRWTLRDKR